MLYPLYLELAFVYIRDRCDLHVRNRMVLLIGSVPIKLIGRRIKLKLIMWQKVKREKKNL